MKYIYYLRVEIICLVFGILGIVYAFQAKSPEAGIALSSSAITAYFSFKRSDDDNIPKN